MPSKIISNIVDQLLANGYSLSIDNGGDALEIPYTKDKETVVAAMFATDDESIICKNDKERAFITFVHGNERNVIHDWSANINYIVEPILDDLSNRFDNRTQN